ncbi:MAG: DUF5678 domain-containing protein [Chloroflexota bacterium]
MSVKVTLNIDNDLYRRAEKIARSRQRDVADLLAESITLPETVSGNDMVLGGGTAVAQEEAAFYRLHPELWQKYPGQYVAIHNEEVVDHDADQVALYLRVKARYPGQFVWIAPVKETPVEEYVVRSPRSVEPA